MFMNLELTLLYFFVYACLGWMVESTHETIKYRTFVNAGFLHGPFVPVYGVAVVLILSINGVLEQFLPAWIRLFLYTLMATVLEYYTSLLLEELFGLKLWDYSQKFLNYRGRVCFQYSFYWFGLSTTLLYVLDPSIGWVCNRLSDRVIVWFNRALGAYMLIDLIYSIRSLNDFKEVLGTLQRKYLSISAGAFDRLIGSVQRLVTSFPNLRGYISNNISENVDIELRDETLDGVRIRRSILALGRRKERSSPPRIDPEYLELVRDIIEHPEFSKLRTYRHHTGTIFDHAVAVSYQAYALCRKAGMDYRSAARGALLHDFFLYDWRDCIQENGEKTKGLHAFTHAGLALENASRHFELNDIEKDIIRKHMWPVTVPFPRYRESFLVTFLDKYVATREMIRGRAMKHKLPEELNPCRTCTIPCGKGEME